MATLKLTFEDIYIKVGEFLGLGSAATGTDLTKIKKLTLRGYANFLMPIDASTGITYRWFFLQQTTTLSTISTVDAYKLPVGFSSLIIPFYNSSAVSYFNPQERPLEFIRDLKSSATSTGYPRYFAIRTGTYSQLTGQQYEVVFWPTPTAVSTYNYTYIQIPNAPINDDDVFVGNDLASEAILECALSLAELQENDIIGIHTQKAEKLVQQLIGDDKRVSSMSNTEPILPIPQQKEKRTP